MPGTKNMMHMEDTQDTGMCGRVVPDKQGHLYNRGTFCIISTENNWTSPTGSVKMKFYTKNKYNNVILDFIL